MQTYALAPLLTEKDPVESAEGGLDPLGTEPLADALATRLIPAVRQRMSHPRFLTAIAVSLEVCRDFDEERIAADEVSEPWQVFEWYLVEGLVRTAETSDRLGLPGSLKASRAIADGVPLSAKRYLKTPTVFGFHGVYRQLARNLGIEEAGRLGEMGFQLLSVWAKDRGLEGFCGTGAGTGRDVREQLVAAVRDGLDAAATDRSSSWSGWEFFSKNLAPYSAGRQEARLLASALLADSTGFRKEVIEFLVSPNGRRAWETTNSEREFHKALRRTASDGLGPLLDAIDAYETFSRLCEDAFRDCLHELTRKGATKTPLAALAKLPAVKSASERVPEMFGDVMSRLEPMGEAARFRDTVTGLAERGTPAEWTQRLIEHHQRTQRQKPPNGKNPWFEQFDDGRLIIRLLPARPDHGILHAKVSLLLWHSYARVIVASANLTEDGYRRNHEVFAALDYCAGSESPLPVLDEILSFLREVVTHADPSAGTPSPAISRWTAFLDRVLKDSRGWGATEAPRWLSEPRASPAQR